MLECCEQVPSRSAHVGVLADHVCCPPGLSHHVDCNLSVRICSLICSAPTYWKGGRSHLLQPTVPSLIFQVSEGAHRVYGHLSTLAIYIVGVMYNTGLIFLYKCSANFC